MLIKLHDAIQRHRLQITGVIHVGAHHGQEVKSYLDAGIKNIVLIEPCNKAYRMLLNHIEELFPGHKSTLDPNGLVVYNLPGEIKISCLQFALGSYRGEAMMHIEKANEGQSNSILTPAKHLQIYSNITFDEKESVKVVPLDTVLIQDRFLYNMINMDVQGYELEVLKGAHISLKDIDYVYTEVNTDELYVNCAKMEHIDSFLTDFERVETEMTDAGWGDAIYVRKPNTKTAIDQKDTPTIEAAKPEVVLPAGTHAGTQSDVQIGKTVVVASEGSKVETTVKIAEGISFSLSDKKYFELVAQIDKQKGQDLADIHLREKSLAHQKDAQAGLVKELRDLFFEEDQDLPGEYVRRKMSAVDAGRFKEILQQIGAWY